MDRLGHCDRCLAGDVPLGLVLGVSLDELVVLVLDLLGVLAGRGEQELPDRKHELDGSPARSNPAVRRGGSSKRSAARGDARLAGRPGPARFGVPARRGHRSAGYQFPSLRSTSAAKALGTMLRI